MSLQKYIQIETVYLIIINIYFFCLLLWIYSSTIVTSLFYSSLLFLICFNCMPIKCFFRLLDPFFNKFSLPHLLRHKSFLYDCYSKFRQPCYAQPIQGKLIPDCKDSFLHCFTWTSRLHLFSKVHGVRFVKGTWSKVC